MSTDTTMALCFVLAYIVALVFVAASLIRKPSLRQHPPIIEPDQPWPRA